MTEKLYLSANELLKDSIRLGLEVYRSGFRPDFIVGVWRGGAPVGIAVQEILKVCGVNADHIAIRTSSYSGIGQREREVQVHGLEYLLANLSDDSRLLLVDDVFDTGLSAKAIVEEINQTSKSKMPAEIRIATPWFKPANKQTNITPDYYLYETDQWLVFPHELEGLSAQEILHHKPEAKALMDEFNIVIQS